MITAAIEIDGALQVLGHYPVLSRWHVGGCANCQTRLSVKADFNLPDLPERHLLALAQGHPDAPAIHVAVRTHDGIFAHQSGGAASAKLFESSRPLVDHQPKFSVTVR
jgi:tyrosinase